MNRDTHVAARDRLPYPSYEVADFQMPANNAIDSTCPECGGKCAMSASLFICAACRLQIPNYPVKT